MKLRLGPSAPYALLAVLCLGALAFRPVIPPDETRYLTAAWEMFLAKSWFVPTVNFEPYHHKPPLLFWLVDAAWALFGVGRAAALLVVFAISAAALRLTGELGRVLLPGRGDVAARLPWLMLGNIVFLIYSSLILFDLLLTDVVLAVFLAMLAFARQGGIRWALLAGALVGLGVLAKGPVVLVHVVWPVLLYPLWRTERETLRPTLFYRGMALALLAALAPVAFWLVPALLRTDGQFAYDLIWEQSAGRISGAMEASHPRPFYFYLLLLPVLGMPWILSPAFWKGGPLRRLGRMRGGRDADTRSVRMLLLWGAGILATFSLISGKQPHYLMPLLPLATVLLGWLMAEVALPAIRRGAVVALVLVVAGQAAASFTYLPRYDLAPVAAFVRDRSDKPFAFIGKYQGELGFLARRRRPIDRIDPGGGEAWLTAHPQGYVIAPQGTKKAFGTKVFEMPYRSRTLSIFAAAAAPTASRR